jgi:Family of unknown function (DUF6084)
MTALSISVVSSQPDRYAVVPTILLRLRLQTSELEPVHAMVLKAQIRIEPQRRRYEPSEEERLVDLFGEGKQWAESLRPFLWTHVVTTVPEFTGSTEIDLPVVCTYDLEVSATRYFHALRDGVVPLVLLFSGTMFSYRDGRLSVQPVAWDVEAKHLLPIAVWRDTMDGFFPNCGWVRLQTETIDALAGFKTSRTLTSWDETIELLLKEADQ